MNANEFDVHDLTDAIGARDQNNNNIIDDNSAVVGIDEGLKFDFNEVKRVHSDSHRSSARMVGNEQNNLLKGEAEEIKLEHL